MSTGSRSKDMDLGDILQNAHLIDSNKLTQARRDSQKSGRPLWHAMTQDEAVSADALFRALRQEVRVPVLAADQLPSVSVPPELLQAIPAKTVQRLGMMPLERSTDGRRAGLAMIDPTDDITPLWPALTAAGVSEVRRFLVHLSTLRLGLEAFYGVTWLPDAELQEAPPPAPAAPPEETLDSDGDPEAEPLFELEEDGSSLAELVAAASKSGNVPVVGASSGHVPRLNADPSPRAGTNSAAAGASSSSLPTANSGPHAGTGRGGSNAAGTGKTAVASPAAGAPVAYRVRREVSLPELPASEIVMLDEMSRPLRVPLVDEASLPAFRSVSMAGGSKEPLQETLLLFGEALVAVLDEDTQSTRPGAIARLSQSVAERLGFAPRAVSELKLVARYYGILRTRLRRMGPLPPASKDVLGFETELPLMAALRVLQTVFVDFMRLPTEADVAPMGARIVDAVATAVDLIDGGLADAALTARLQQLGTDSMITGALIQSLETDLPALSIQREPLPPLSNGSGTLVAAKPPTMPDVPWRTRSVAQLPDQGIEAYTPAGPTGST